MTRLEMGPGLAQLRVLAQSERPARDEHGADPARPTAHQGAFSGGCGTLRPDGSPTRSLTAPLLNSLGELGVVEPSLADPRNPFDFLAQRALPK